MCMICMHTCVHVYNATLCGYICIYMCVHIHLYMSIIYTCQRASNQVNFSIRSGIKEGPIPLGGLITHSPSLVTSIPLVPIL